MEISDYRLKDIKFVATDKNKQLFGPGKLDTIIIHYTAGPSAESSIKHLTDPQVKASAHVVVDREGVIAQLVPFNIQAWHAGPSQFGDRTGFNQYSIGIEIDNAGLLEKRGEKYYAWFGKAYPENEVIHATHRNQTMPAYWHTFTEKQIEAVEQLCRLLVDTYKLKYILGHEEISPGRKIDPGPAFPLDKLRDRIFGGLRDEDTPTDKSSEGIVSVDLLNIRSEANAQAERIAKPLGKGQKVKILAAKDGWLKVSTEIIGWVSSKYIK